MSFDLKTLDTASVAEDGAILDLLHPITKEAVGCSITLVGGDSERYRKARNAMLKKRFRHKGAVHDIDAMLEDDVRLLAACTLGWDGVEEDGVPVSFSEKAAFGLYMRYPWVREQVAEFIGERANFLPNDAQS